LGVVDEVFHGVFVLTPQRYGKRLIFPNFDVTFFDLRKLIFN
jgi:hypothetical protein